jgi:histone H3/H4
MLNGEPVPQLVCLLSANMETSKTVTALDVVYALKRSGRTLYGFGA